MDSQDTIVDSVLLYSVSGLVPKHLLFDDLSKYDDTLSIQ